MEYKDKYAEKKKYYDCKENDNIIGMFLIKDIREESFSLDEFYIGTKGIDGEIVIGIHDFQEALNRVGYMIVKKEIKND